MAKILCVATKNVKKMKKLYTEEQLAGALFDLLGEVTTTNPFSKMEVPLFLDILEKWAAKRGINTVEADIQNWNIKPVEIWD